MPKCTINKTVVEVESGSTIIQAYKKLEKQIAHYCWHPGLSVAGVCRLCMVEIQGNPKLQIACNTLVEDGMVITNQSKKVKDTVRWGLEFHLINHPLDCPICDQAGECVLQEQYMKFGNYDPLMAEPKVKKRKVVDLGSKIVLDTERCILCSRCTRFTDEISKTKELGIFNRGDKSEIGIFKDKPLENNYALNTVDICPVGALTSKQFRFQQRVWYLKSADSICTGCSTGCNTTVYYNEEGLWRLTPRYNKDINQHWMCDQGRETFKPINRKTRLQKALKITPQETQKMKTSRALEQLKSENGSLAAPAALVLTGQYTLEEYNDFLSYFSKTFPSSLIYHWKNNPKSFDFFDGFLIRGDKNPNTLGLEQAMRSKNFKFSEWSFLKENLKNQKIKTLFVCGPENPLVFPCLEENIRLFLTAQTLVWISPHAHQLFYETKNTVWAVPSKTSFEKSGTFINNKGYAQKIKALGRIIQNALSLSEIALCLENKQTPFMLTKKFHPEMKENHFLKQKGNL